MKRYSIGEVCSILDVPAHTLRYWEQEIDLLRPKKDDGGRRSYAEADLQLLYRLKYLLYTRKFTLSGAKHQLISDSNPGRTGHVGPVRELRSDLFSLLSTVQSLKLNASMRSELPELYRTRSDAPHLERVWRQTDPRKRLALSRALDTMPDYWVDHVKRLSAPGRLLNDTRQTAVRPTLTMQNLSSGPDDSALRDMRAGTVSLLWVPGTPDDIARGIDSRVLDQVPLIYIAADREKTDMLDDIRRRRPLGSRIRFISRYEIPVLSPDGHLQVDAEGTIRTVPSVLPQALVCATLPQVRAQLMNCGVSTLGLLVGSLRGDLDHRLLALHKKTHASLTIAVRKRDGRVSLSGPLWCDLGFLGQASRPAYTDLEQQHPTGTAADLRIGTIVERAAVSNVVLLE